MNIIADFMNLYEYFAPILYIYIGIADYSTISNDESPYDKKRKSLASA